MAQRSFTIKEAWAASLWLPAIPAALLFAGAWALILPAGLGAALRFPSALVLGAASVILLLYAQKREHLARHKAEAAFLGFRCELKGSLWNPFSAPELALSKPAGGEEEDGLLADLVLMHGPDYELAGLKLARGRDIALAAGILALLAAPGAAREMAPLFGAAGLLFLFSEAELYFARYEARRVGHERRAMREPGADYLEWNFLSLEAKRLGSGRVPGMEKALRRILTEEAGLASGAAILEAGAGGGFLWAHAPEELRAAWTQAEKNPHAGLYAARHGRGSLFLRSDIKALPFPDASFDAVVGLECFDAIAAEDVPAFFAEAARLLKPGGRLVHLKDFADWPEAALADRFRRFSMKVLRRTLVRTDKRKRLVFAGSTPEEKAALARAAALEGPAERPYAKTLSAIYSAGPGSDARFAAPMLVSMMALKEFLKDAGFVTVSDSLSAPVTGPVAYLIARKGP